MEDPYLFKPNVKNDPWDVMDDFLKLNYPTPSPPPPPALCEHVIYDELQNRLSRGRRASTSEVEDDNLAEELNSVNTGKEVVQEATSASSAREGALPVVKLVPTGTWEIGIPSMDEVFKIVAIGTISPEIYLDIVWDVIQSFPGYHTRQVGVYEVDKMPFLRFLVWLNGQLFELKYFQSEALARRIGDLCETPDDFLQTCGPNVQQAIKEIKECARSRRIFEVPGFRRAYYTMRAWADLRGLLKETTQQEIITALTKLASVSQIDQNSILQSIFADLPLGTRPYPEMSLDGSWVQLLKHLGDRPMHERIQGPNYFTIDVMHSCSSTLAGRWLTHVEKKLPELEKSLKSIAEERKSNSRVYGIDFKTEVFRWPYRLVKKNSDPKAVVYEGLYLIGINFDPTTEENKEIKEIINKWEKSIKRHQYTVTGCFITTTSATSLHLKDLKRCLRTLYRPFLPPPNKPIEDASQESAKENRSFKRNNHTNNASTPRLRTATDIHNRLKHDPNYNIDEYVLGYEDRISHQIVETPAADWERETTDEAFIPESRIRYFKHYSGDGGKEQVVWERARKIDRVFGSGNGEGEGEE